MATCDTIYTTVFWVLLCLIVGFGGCITGGQQHSNSGEMTTDRKTVLHVDVENGDDNGCLNSTSQLPCHSIEHIAHAIANWSGSVEIVIKGPKVELRKQVHFSNFVELKLTGNFTEIECTSTSGFHPGIIFTWVDNVILQNLTLRYCGAFQNHTGLNKYYKYYRAAIYINTTVNITASNVVVSSSNGTGIAISNVTGGTVSISNCLFEHNMIPKEDAISESYAGGGGVSVRIWSNYGKPNNFIFDKCRFLNNTPSAMGPYVFLTAFGTTISGTGRGGGLSITITNSAANNMIRVTDCTFSRNKAFIGGGLAVQIGANSQHNSVLVANTTFKQNGYQDNDQGWRTGSGGGAHFGYTNVGAKTRQKLHDNQFLIENVTFKQNCAELGGGTTFYSSRSENINSNNSICFDNCTWLENFAYIGAAVDISPHVFDRFSGGYLPVPQFKDCQFIDNTVVNRMKDLNQALGSGTLFASLFDVTFKSSVNFTNNNGSAFIIVNGIANFSSCDAMFINNTGVQGGAIALLGISSMVVGPHSHYTFIQNRATDRGGAIYASMIDEHDFTASRSCFIQYSKWRERNVTFQFKGNLAQNYGHSIFATSITPCLFVWNTRDSEVFRWPHNVFIYDENDTIEHQIATDGASFNVSGRQPIEIVPGEEHILPVSMTDDLDQTITDTTFRASIIREKGREKIHIGDAFSYLSSKAIRLHGKERQEGKLLLEAVGPRKNSIVLDIVLATCPPGYSLSSQNVCTCDAYSYVGFTKCGSGTKFQAYIKPGFWAGYVTTENNELSLVSGFCPLGFCTYNGSGPDHDVQLPHNASQSVLDQFMCGPKRTGILCGTCKKGHTTYYHSPHYSCKKVESGCKNGWAYYFLSELVPVTLLFVIVLVFNISLTSGATNGFILFSQLLDALFIDGSGVIKFSGPARYLTWGHHVIYGFFSLDFINIEPLSFCLWEGATVLDVLAFKYVTIAYALILILGAVMFMKHLAPRIPCRCLRITTIKTSVIHGLSTFIVICYAQCIKMSLNILLPQTLFRRHGEPHYPKRVWLSGDVEEFGKEHLPYAIPAIFCIMTLGAIPPILLISYPLLNRVMVFFKIAYSSPVVLLSRAIPVGKMKPFFDSFQGTYKDNLRFFAGIYLLYRWVGILSYAVTESLGACYTLIEVMLIIILMVHAMAQPYEARWHNLLDAVLFADLALINVFTAFNYAYSTYIINMENAQNIIDCIVLVQAVFIYIPIFYIIAYTFAVGYKKLKPKVISSCKQDEGNSSAVNGNGTSTTSFIPLEEFPARMLGDGIDYDMMSDSSLLRSTSDDSIDIVDSY